MKIIALRPLETYAVFSRAIFHTSKIPRTHRYSTCSKTNASRKYCTWTPLEKCSGSV